MTLPAWMDAILQHPAARGLAGVSFAVLLVTALVNIFARQRRRELRRAVTLYLIYLLGIALQAAVSWFGPADGARWLGVLNDVVMALAVVHLGAIVVFDIATPLVAISLPTLVSDIAVGVAYIVATGTVLSQNGVDLTSFVAASSLAAAVLTLSLQSTLGNVIGGVALQLDGSVRPDQWVQLENGRQGRVREIRWRHTLLETRDGDTLVVPNAWLLQSQILVLGAREGNHGAHRMWVHFQVDFRFQPAHVIHVVEEALRSAPFPGVSAAPPPDCVCLDFARERRESYVLYAVRYWLTDLAKDDPTSSLVRERLYAALKRADIPFAAPLQRVVRVDETEEQRLARRLSKARAAVDRVEMFRVLTDDERQAIAERLIPVSFAAGEVMTRQGAIAHWLYVLASGTAEIRVTGEGGKDRAVARIDSPGFFGEMGLMTGEPRSASVVAVTACDTFRLDKASFQDVLTQRPEIAQEVSAVLLDRRVRLGIASRRSTTANGAVAEEQAELLKRIRSFFGL